MVLQKSGRYDHLLSMSNIKLTTARYEECNEELLAFRNANRDMARSPEYFDWRYLKRPCSAKAIILWASREKLGMCSVIPHEYAINDRVDHLGVLGDISVAKEWRGKGVARQMFAQMAGMQWISIISHKLLRWLVPIFCIIAFGSNAFLAGYSSFYLFVFGLQIAFYTLAAIGYALDKRGIHNKIYYLPLYFCIVNLASLISIFKVLMKENIVTWQTQR